MENRFAFMKKTGCVWSREFSKEWEEYGAQAFEFEILERLEQGEMQTDTEYNEDLKSLFKMIVQEEA